MDQTTGNSPSEAAAPVAPGGESHAPVAPSSVLGSAGEPSAAPSGDQSAGMAPDGGAPDYTDFVLPDGSTADAEAMSEAKAFFAGKRLSQDDAQSAVDLHMRLSRQQAERDLAHWRTTNENWVKEIRSDPEIGGPRFDASLASAARAIEFARIPGLKEALDMTGAGNNPAIVKAFVRFGQVLGEDRFRAGMPGSQENRSIAERLYDGSPRG